MSDGPQEYGDTYDDDMEFPVYIRHYEGSGYYARGWNVTMPHQCDEWRIVEDEDDLTEAIATLDRFETAIREAKDKLKQVGA